jgi:hypothetical protein
MEEKAKRVFKLIGIGPKEEDELESEKAA